MSQVPGDLAAFCEREYPRLVGTLSLYCGDRHLAEELAQEALARACDRWSRVREMTAPGAWVHRVAINAANSHWRRRRAARRAQHRLEAAAPSNHVDPDVTSSEVLRDAVGALPPRQRTALLLRYFVDLSPEEVAGVMDVSPQAVRNLTHRAIRQLRIDLADPELLEVTEPEASDVC